MTFKVTLGIYYQALKLWLKGVATYDHPKHNNHTKRSTTKSAQATQPSANSSDNPSIIKEAPDTAL
jgi:hypothetical protein